MMNKGTSLFSLEGKIALVTGASGYLGKSITESLCAAGAHVIINGRKESSLREFSLGLESNSFKTSLAPFDITDDHALKQFVKTLETDFGRLDILVNNAYSGRTGTFSTSTKDDFNTAYEVTVTSAFRLIQLTMHLLRVGSVDNPGGASVINIASMYGMVSPDPSIYKNSSFNNPPFYGAAKAGLIQLTKYMACHLAPFKIRVNCISPGPFPQENAKADHPEFYNHLCLKTPMNRTGHPDELCGPILFLASDASSYVTGINLQVDGGWTSW